MIVELDDEDGYPTEECLESIKTAQPSGQELHAWALDMLLSVEPIWQYGSAGYWSSEDDVGELYGLPIKRFSISTAGWSGNESLIDALQDNFYFWHTAWVQTRRGGHYIFEVDISTANDDIQSGAAS